jgi:hypothetical protein
MNKIVRAASHQDVAAVRSREELKMKWARC